MVVYLDVLFCLNAIGTLFQLLAACLLCRRRARAWRVTLASLLGGAGAAAIFFLPEGNVLAIAAQLTGISMICAAAFAPCPWRNYGKLAAVFGMVGILYAGTASAVWYLLEPAALTVRNGVVYFEIPPLLLVGSTAGCYLLLTLISRFTSRQPQRIPHSLIVESNGRRVRVDAIVDTGSALIEPISGDDVLVISAEAVSPLFSEREMGFFLDPVNCTEGAPPGIRLVPAGTVAGSTLLGAFRPDSVCMDDPKGAPVKWEHLYVAVCPHRLSDDYSALISGHMFTDT